MASLVSVSQSSLSRPQLVQNAAAQFLTNTSTPQHIAPVLSSLHWLPVAFRIDFKILVFVFKALNGLGPPYLSDLLSVRNQNRALRSANQVCSKSPEPNTKTGVIEPSWLLDPDSGLSCPPICAPSLTFAF